jgi:putative transposase
VGDGLYVKAGLEDTKAALLVIIGALKDGRKVVPAVESGQRESTASWGRILRGLRDRGLRPWKVTVADGHLAIWATLRDGALGDAEQGCWNHRITNVLDQLPKREWSEACATLRKLPYAAAQEDCERLRDQFALGYRKPYPKAVETLGRDWERMVTFYRFPQETWILLRTSNPVESPFSAVRLRMGAGKRYKKVANAEALIWNILWKILMIAEKKFRRLNAPKLFEDVYAGKKFVDGVGREQGQPEARRLTRLHTS